MAFRAPWRGIFLAFALAAGGGAARACTVALLLAIDVSNSIDPTEYSIQADGLATALLDNQVREALVQGEVALSVVQWSGEGQYRVSIPWQQVRTDIDVLTLAGRARGMRRAFVNSNTAVGGLMRFALSRFPGAPDCTRRVIDISGDGIDNAGTDPQTARVLAESLGVEINALAIEGIGVSITGFYTRHVITRNGFVMTARGHRSYADTLKRKMRREVSQVMF